MSSNIPQDVDRVSPTNWLDDRWWIKLAYHTNRAPLLINSNWWLLYKDDPSTPNDLKMTKDSRGFTNWQILRAAWLTRGLLHIKQLLDKGEQLPDLSKAGQCLTLHCLCLTKSLQLDGSVLVLTSCLV